MSLPYKSSHNITESQFKGDQTDILPLIAAMKSAKLFNFDNLILDSLRKNITYTYIISLTIISVSQYVLKNIINI